MIEYSKAAMRNASCFYVEMTGIYASVHACLKVNFILIEEHIRPSGNR